MLNGRLSLLGDGSKQLIKFRDDKHTRPLGL
jgi:hypothetical protein